MLLSDWLVSLNSPDAYIFWALTLTATLVLWIYYIVKFCIFVDFELPDDGLRVIASDFSIFVFIYSCSKYTDDYPYFAAMGTALFEYLMFSTFLVRLSMACTCGMWNPLSIAILAVNQLMFIAGTSFNVSRAVWALWVVDSATTRDLVIGESAALDTLWYCLGGMVTVCFIYVAYSQNRRARQEYLRVPVNQSAADALPARMRLCSCCR